MFTVPSALISSSVRNTSLPATTALPDAAEPEAAEEEDALPQGRQILAAVGDRLTAQLHPTRLHRLQTVQTAQQGALAAAGRPHHTDHQHQTGGLDHAGDEVDGQRDEPPHRLGDDDVPIGLRPAHAQRLAALILMLRDSDEGTADEVAHLGRAPEHEHNDRRRLMPRLRALSVWMGSMASSPLRKASAM